MNTGILWFFIGALTMVSGYLGYLHLNGNHGAGGTVVLPHHIAVAPGNNRHIGTRKIVCADETSPVYYRREPMQGTAAWAFIPADSQRWWCLVRKSLAGFFLNRDEYIVFDPDLMQNTSGSGGQARGYINNIAPFAEPIAQFLMRKNAEPEGWEHDGMVVLSSSLCRRALLSPSWRHGTRLQSCLYLAVESASMQAVTLSGVNGGYMPDMSPERYQELLGLGFVEI